MTSPRKEAPMEDRLTDLPDSILCHILSFLPTLEAVQTVLLRRFGTLWTSLQNLDFDDNDYFWPEGEDVNTYFFQFVHNVLALHQRPTIERFRVNIETMLYEDIGSEHWRQEIDSWLTFALGKQVKVLEFEFGMVEPVEENYKLPFTEFVSSSIVELKLVNIDMRLPIRVQLSSLRVLKLEFMDVSDEAFGEIIRGCPLLKKLEIFCSFSTEVKSPYLEILKLETMFSYGNPTKINCPKLSSFEYKGGLDDLEILNVSSLVHFDFRELYITEQEYNHFTHFQSVLNKLLHVETVTLSSDFVVMLFYRTQKHSPPTLVNWTQMELSIWFTMKHIHCLCQLLKYSPYLEKLVLNVSFWDSDLFKAIESQDSELVTNSQEVYCWSSLKTIIIHYISSSSYDVMVHLIEILLKSSPVLDQLLIYYNTKDKKSELPVCSMTSEQFSELSGKLQTFTKASKTAKVLLL